MGETWNWLTSSEQWSGDDGIPARLVEHIWYSALGVVVAALIAFPLGLLIGHTGRGSLVANSMSNFWRALPTLGVVILVFRIEPLSIWPVLVALIVIAIPPILLNTEVGHPLDRPRRTRRGPRDGNDRLAGPVARGGATRDAADPRRLRSATGQVIATATIAAYVGLGGLGRYIIDGYSVRDIGEVTGGAVVVAVLALLVEGGFALLQRSLGPKEGSRRKRRDAGPAVHQEEVHA